MARGGNQYEGYKVFYVSTKGFKKDSTEPVGLEMATKVGEKEYERTIHRNFSGKLVDIKTIEVEIANVVNKGFSLTFKDEAAKEVYIWKLIYGLNSISFCNKLRSIAEPNKPGFKKALNITAYRNKSNYATLGLFVLDGSNEGKGSTCDWYMPYEELAKMINRVTVNNKEMSDISKIMEMVDDEWIPAISKRIAEDLEGPTKQQPATNKDSAQPTTTKQPDAEWAVDDFNDDLPF